MSMEKATLQPNKPLQCPRCQCKYLHRFGHDRDGFQKYQCVGCKHQFSPEKPVRQKKPKVICPLCGRAMYPYKSFTGYVRYRCAAYRRQDETRCVYKLNLYTAKDEQENQAQSFWENQWGQELLSLKPFSWSKMNFSKETVGLSLYYAIERALPATEVSQIMKDIYQLKVSHDSVTNWTHKAGAQLAKQFKDFSFDLSQDSLHTDETAFKAGRLRPNQRRTKLTNKIWVWQSKAKKSKVVTGLSFSLRRDTPSAREHFQTVKESTTIEPQEFIQDSLWSYGAAFPEVWNNPETIRKRKTYQDFSDERNNNPVERQHGYLKSYCKRHRGFKSILGLIAYNVSRTIIWNFFKGRPEFDGKTPAEKAGVTLPKDKPKLIHWL
jgi:putative transposase